jgi:hypothetical protein|tara:strand:+ start:36 stop:371 length:336 start_codon:yes stop_codon:yes gene_type:complete
MREIFVFGSNLAGRHGKGAALYAKQHHGAIYGQGVGLQGDSYAIPTKYGDLRVLRLQWILHEITDFMAFVKSNPDMQFNITRIGCGLAGYDWDKDIRPLFPTTLPTNCKFI